LHDKGTPHALLHEWHPFLERRKTDWKDLHLSWLPAVFPVGIAYRFLEKCFPERKPKQSIQSIKELAPELQCTGYTPFLSSLFQILLVTDIHKKQFRTL